MRTLASALFFAAFAGPACAGDVLADAVRVYAPSEEMAGACLGSLQFERYLLDRALASFDQPPRGVVYLGSGYLTLGVQLVGRVHREPTALILANEEIQTHRLDEATLQRLEAQLDTAAPGGWNLQRLHSPCVLAMDAQGMPIPISPDALEGDLPMARASQFLDTLYVPPTVEDDDES